MNSWTGRTIIGIALCAPGLAEATTFGPAQVISDAVVKPGQLFVADLDGDGDGDVVADDGEQIVWFENLGGGSFAALQTISDPYGFGDLGGLTAVHGSDLDGDGDVDVLATDSPAHAVVWYENLGGGSFGTQQVITDRQLNASSVSATDLDGDGDPDVLAMSPSVSGHPDDVPYVATIDWYENLGAGDFARHTVALDYGDTLLSVLAADLDGDGDDDVVSTGYYQPTSIAWYENLGGGSFGPQQVISTVPEAPYQASAADLDGDGDPDLVWASHTDDRVAWHENLGGGLFDLHDITTDAELAESVFAMDLDLDGDVDVLSASSGDDVVAWYENLGGGSFGPPQVINNAPYFYVNVEFVYAADLDGDGDPDVLSSSRSGDGVDSRIDWFENLLVQLPDTADTGTPPVVETADTGSDVDDTGVVDSGEPASAGTTDASDVMGTASPGCGCTTGSQGAGSVWAALFGRRRVAVR